MQRVLVFSNGEACRSLPVSTVLGGIQFTVRVASRNCGELARRPLKALVTQYFKACSGEGVPREYLPLMMLDSDRIHGASEQ